MTYIYHTNLGTWSGTWNSEHGTRNLAELDRIWRNLTEPGGTRNLDLGGTWNRVSLTDPVVDVRRRVVDPVPKRAIYSIMCILFFSTEKVSNMLFYHGHVIHPVAFKLSLAVVFFGRYTTPNIPRSTETDGISNQDYCVYLARNCHALYTITTLMYCFDVYEPSRLLWTK